MKVLRCEAFIPLASVPVGEYTIAGFQIERSDDIYQYQKTIIFRISRLLPITVPVEKEEVIAEVEPEIIEEEPIISEETKVAAVVEESDASKKKRVKTQPKPKRKVVKTNTKETEKRKLELLLKENHLDQLLRNQ